MNQDPDREPSSPESGNDHPFEHLKDERAFEDAKRVAANAQSDEQGFSDGEDEDLLEEFPDEVDDIDLTHSRITSLKSLNLPRFRETLVKLCLRQNLLQSLVVSSANPDEPSTTRDAPLEKLERLEELDLYDNKLSRIEGLRGLSALRVLDLSFNLIRKLPPSNSPDSLSQYPKLHTLYLVQNSIRTIGGLNGLAENLRSLELGGNKIKEIEGLESLTNLEELWLGKNRISAIRGLDSLKRLRVLSIQSNRITEITGLDKLTALEELYVSHNGLHKLTGLENNTNLTVLDVSANRITTNEGVEKLLKLEEFWANDNLIEAQPDPLVFLEKLEHLGTVYLEGNPLQKAWGANYRRKVMLALPQISQLDALFVKRS